MYYGFNPGQPCMRIHGTPLALLGTKLGKVSVLAHKNDGKQEQKSVTYLIGLV